MFRAVFRQILDSWTFGASPNLFLASSGLFLASSGLFLASSGLFLASSFFGCFLDSAKSSKFKGSQRRYFLFIKYCLSSSFSPNSGFLAFWCLFSNISYSSGPLLASSGPLLASSGPLLASSGPLLASSWLLLASGFQRRHFLFIKHCVSSIFFPNSGFLAFRGFFVRNPAYPVVFGRRAPVASLRLRLGPVEDNDRRRRCPSPRWDAWKTLELNPKMLELRVVLGWAVCYAQVRAAWVCIHTSEHP